MELDDMKLAWQTLDRRLDLQTALNLHLFKESRFDRMRAKLLPMRLAQVVRLLFGAALMIFAAPVWAEHGRQPILLISGLAVHLYGLALCITGGRNLWLAAHIDYAAPVVYIQQQLLRLRTAHLRSSFWLGNAWGLLWMPLLIVVMMWTDSVVTDAILDASMPVIVPRFAVSVLVGVVAIAATAWLYGLWRKKRPDAVRKFEDQSSRSIANAQKVLDEVERFEKM